tara:strand:+ start:6371 stop:7828 length:1458 start_codon:yes stop_codon:yes gene_type:complete
MADTVPAMLEPGEFVIRRDAAKKIGQPALHALNNFDRNHGSHGAIDELIALGNLGMQEGGEVKEPFGQRATNAIINARMGLLGMLDPQLKHFRSDDMEDASEWQNVLGRGMTYNKMNEDMEGSAEDFRSLQETEFTEGPMKGAVLRNILSESIKDGDLGGSDIKEEFSLETDKNRYNLEPEHWYSPIKMQTGGNVNDPLQIGKRMADPSIYEGSTLGVVDEDASLISDLQRMRRDINLLKLQEMRYPDSKMFNKYRQHMAENNSVMSQEEMMGILGKAARKTQGMFKPKGYQGGGHVYEYGESETGIPSLQDIFNQANIQPNEDNIDRFQEYDSSREETRVDSYYDNLEAVRVGSSAKAEAARKKSQKIGKGFTGMGAREAGVEDTLSSLMGAQERAGEKEYRGLFEDIRGMREDYTKEQTGLLYDLDRAEGTIEADSPEYDPANNPPGYEGYGEPSDGASYTDTNGENWVYDGMAHQWKKEQGE